MKHTFGYLLILILTSLPATLKAQLPEGKWFASASIGMQTPFVGGTSGARMATPYYSIALNKQVTNIFVARFKVEGTSLRSRYNKHIHETNYMMMHADIMPCLSYWLSNTADWEILPYVGLGYYHGFTTKELKAADMLSVHFGVKGVWQILPAVGLFGEVGIAVLPNEFDRYQSKRNQEGIGSLAIGLTWHFGK